MDSIITTWIPGGRPPISRGPPSPPIPPPTPIPPFRPDPGKKSASTDPTPDDSDGDVSAHAAGSQLPNLPPGTDFYAPYLIRTGVQTDDNIVMRRVQRDLNTHDAAETEVLYYTVPKERFLELEVTDDSTLPYSILDGLCPELKVQFWNDEMWGPKLGDLASSQLEISSTGWSFTNYSARRTDTKTGDIVVEFCLDGLKLSYLWERHTPIRTPRGKPVIALDHERIGVVERVCVCLRRTAGSGANPRWSLDIISPFGISSYFDGFNTLMGNLNAGTLWTQLAVHDPRRLVLEIVRTMLSWRNLDEELRVKVTNTCEVMLQRASMVLHQELRVLQDCQLALESNLNFVNALQVDLSIAAVPGPDLSEYAENDEIIAEFRSVGSGLKQNILFVKQLKEELATTIDMIFSAVQVDQSIQTLKEGVLVYEQAESMRRLTYLTVFFLPATFIATIFGMNSPATSSPPLWLYFVVSVPLSVVSFCLLYGFRYISELQRLNILFWQRFKPTTPNTDIPNTDQMKNSKMHFDGILQWFVAVVRGLFGIVCGRRKKSSQHVMLAPTELQPQPTMPERISTQYQYQQSPMPQPIPSEYQHQLPSTHSTHYMDQQQPQPATMKLSGSSSSSIAAGTTGQQQQAPDTPSPGRPILIPPKSPYAGQIAPQPNLDARERVGRIARVHSAYPVPAPYPASVPFPITLPYPATVPYSAFVGQGYESEHRPPALDHHATFHGSLPPRPSRRTSSGYERVPQAISAPPPAGSSRYPEYHSPYPAMYEHRPYSSHTPHDYQAPLQVTPVNNTTNAPAANVSNNNEISFNDRYGGGASFSPSPVHFGGRSSRPGRSILKDRTQAEAEGDSSSYHDYLPSRMAQQSALRRRQSVSFAESDGAHTDPPYHSPYYPYSQNMYEPVVTAQSAPSPYAAPPGPYSAPPQAFVPKIRRAGYLDRG